ncbi:hypothetical protein CRYO30217_00524 [Parvicella tangerina]|uniref:Carboxypeptidase regulatory-like domain-containing protein n=2 Tax=Parvicella tangerina TaxID=2829795 RepID=A0A916NF88_9FLAO|nr:hypothetical protein CRYO30217_00524 [Parvicella tangerina]
MILMTTWISVSFGGLKSELAIGYKIIQDTTSSDVGPERCLVQGVVKRNNGQVVENALVYGQQTRAVRTNNEGAFRILLDTADQYLTVSKGDELQGYMEGYKFKGGHEITCEIYVYDINEMLIVDKPVIYLYSENEVDVELTLRTEMELTFTYPLISATNKWETKVSADGITTADGRNYPYLFWEAETSSLTYRREETSVVGDIVGTDTLISYLENKLDCFGLNSKERTDFITYWGPRMTPYNFVLTQFNFDEVVEQMAALEVSPTPDSQRRVFMLFTGFEAIPDIEITPPEEIDEPFERTGFCLLEWGGTEVSRKQLYHSL